MKRHLVIGDDEDISKQVVNCLLKIGHLFDSIRSDTNTAILQEIEKYDLIFCNTQLKEKSGFDFINQFLIQYPNMSIIMIANKTFPNMAGEIRKLGAIDFISIPVDCDRVAISVANALTLKQMNLLNNDQENENNLDHKFRLRDLSNKLKIAQKIIIQSEKMAAVGHLSAGVAHEINNPVGFIATNLNTLQHYQKSLMAIVTQYRKLLADLEKSYADIDKNSTISRRISKIKRLQSVFDLNYLCRDTLELIRENLAGISRVKRIVRDLKAFIHPGQDYPELINLHDLLDSTLNLVRHKLKYNLEVEKEYGNLPQINCRVNEVNQVFLNLIINAIQSIELKGTISIKTQMYDENWVEIYISDSGKGIPESYLTKIFKPFFTTKPVGEGTGLGLYMSNKIIKHHGGTISVDSQVGHGSTFKIRIPVNFQKTD